MGEIDKDTQDTLQGTPGQPSGDQVETTSEKPTRTYTEQEAQKLVSDALAAKGRDAKALADKEASLNTLQEEIKAAQAQIADFERQKDEAELEAARRDPDKMAEYQQKKSYRKLMQDLETQRKDLKRQQDEFNRQKAEHEAEVQQTRQTTMEVKIWQIGAKYGVDPAMLKDLNLPTVEAVEAVAKRLGTAKPKETAEPFKVDSGVTTGGGAPTLEQLSKMTPDEYAAHRRKQDPDRFPL
ncbi:MAG: hypothetical protein R6U93_09220 [Dehalococcoidia bacterium]